MRELDVERGLALRPFDFLARVTNVGFHLVIGGDVSAESMPSVPRLVSRNALAASHALARFSRRVRIWFILFLPSFMGNRKSRFSSDSTGTPSGGLGIRAFTLSMRLLVTALREKEKLFSGPSPDDADSLNRSSSQKPNSSALLAFIHVSASIRWESFARDRPVLIS